MTIYGGTWWNNQWGDGDMPCGRFSDGSRGSGPDAGCSAGNNAHIQFEVDDSVRHESHGCRCHDIYGAYGINFHPGGDNTYSVSDAAMTTGSTTLTSTTGGFTAAQQGLPIRVVGASAAGRPLHDDHDRLERQCPVLANANASGGNITGKVAVVHNVLGGD